MSKLKAVKNVFLAIFLASFALSFASCSKKPSTPGTTSTAPGTNSAAAPANVDIDQLAKEQFPGSPGVFIYKYSDGKITYTELTQIPVLESINYPHNHNLQKYLSISFKDRPPCPAESRDMTQFSCVENINFPHVGSRDLRILVALFKPYPSYSEMSVNPVQQVTFCTYQGGSGLPMSHVGTISLFTIFASIPIKPRMLDQNMFSILPTSTLQSGMCYVVQANISSVGYDDNLAWGFCLD
ncbi:MAG: hypothetical protein ABIH66_05810 [bacterium]